MGEVTLEEGKNLENRLDTGGFLTENMGMKLPIGIIAQPGDKTVGSRT